MKYYFYTAGALPIIGGIYAGVAVEVDDAHTKILSVTPLGQAVIVDAQPSPQSSKSPEASPSIDLLDIPQDKES